MLCILPSSASVIGKMKHSNMTIRLLWVRYSPPNRHYRPLHGILCFHRFSKRLFGISSLNCIHFSPARTNSPLRSNCCTNPSETTSYEIMLTTCGPSWNQLQTKSDLLSDASKY